MDFEISVIIPSYNRKHTLMRALESVFVQSYRPREIIVVDDCSDDGTAAAIQAIKSNYCRLRYIRHTVNLGVSAARNTGLAHAQGNWIAFLDSDDVWMPEKLESQVNLLKKNRKYLICHTEEIWVRNGRRVNPMKKHTKQGGDIFERSLSLCLISPSSVIIHRLVFERVGLFDTSMLACEDYDYWLRMCSRYPVLFVKQAMIIKYGGHSDQLSKKFWGMDRMRIRAIRGVLQQADLSLTARQAALEVLLKKCQYIINGARKRDKPKMLAYYTSIYNKYEKQLKGLAQV